MNDSPLVAMAVSIIIVFAIYTVGFVGGHLALLMVNS